MITVWRQRLKLDRVSLSTLIPNVVIKVLKTLAATITTRHSLPGTVVGITTRYSLPSTVVGITTRHSLPNTVVDITITIVTSLKLHKKGSVIENGLL